MTSSPEFYLSDFGRANVAEAKVEELQKKIKKLEEELVTTRHTLFRERIEHRHPPIPPPPPLLPPPERKRPGPPLDPRLEPAEYKSGFRVRGNKVSMYATDVYMWGSKLEIQADYVFNVRVVKKRRLDDEEVGEMTRAIEEVYAAAQGEMNTSAFIAGQMARDKAEIKRKKNN